MSDSIADMITRIRNGYAAHTVDVRIPHSKLKEALAHLLEKETYIDKVEVEGDGVKKELKLTLRYNGKMPAVTGIKRLSKPGLRKYSTANRIPRALGGYGITVISTSAGVMSDKDARKKGIGGELLCSIW